MLVVAFVTVIIGESLFPDERDFRVLGRLPVRKSALFGATLAALALFTGLLFAVIHASLFPLLLLTSIHPNGQPAVLSRLVAWILTGVGASMLVVLAVAALVGVSTLTLAHGRWRELPGLLRSAVLGMLVVGVPFVLRLPDSGDAFADRAGWMMFLPPAWFVGLQQVIRGSRDPWFLQLAGLGLAALAAAGLVVAATYVVLFRRFEHLMLGSSRATPAGSHADGVDGHHRATPGFRGVHQFTLLTLRRSQLHQGVLVGIVACGLAVALRSTAPVSAPFALMFICGLAVRATLVLPIEHRANWIFRMAENPATRADQLRAVDRLVTSCVVGVPVSVALPLLWSGMGAKSLGAVAVVALTGFIFVHAVLVDWRRIPFTASYLPGKRFAAHSLVVGGACYWLLIRAGNSLALAAAADFFRALAIAVAMASLGWLLRRRRLAAWTVTPLMFEDELPDQPTLVQFRQ